MSGRPKHKTIDMEYFKYLKPDSLLSTKDLIEIFNVKSQTQIVYREKNKIIPKHDLEMDGSNKHGTIKKHYYWRAKTIMDYINSEMFDL